MARLLVLGAGGFIGRAVRRELAGAHEVACIDRIVAGGESGEEWFQLDLLEASPDEIVEVTRRVAPHAVINCAGLVDGPTEQLVRGNVLLVARLLEIADAEHLRLVHLGSAAEYGVSDPETTVDEHSPPHPLTPYAVTKLCGTLLVANAIRSGALSGVVLRLFNPLGPGMPVATMPGRAAALIQSARASGSASITMGPLDAWRDFVDLRDVAVAIVAAALAADLDASILNVGSGRAVQARDVVRAIADAAGWHGEVREVQELASSRSAGVNWQQASTSRIEMLLGWRSRHTIDEAAASLVGSDV